MLGLRCCVPLPSLRSDYNQIYQMGQIILKRKKGGYVTVINIVLHYLEQYFSPSHDCSRCALCCNSMEEHLTMTANQVNALELGM